MEKHKANYCNFKLSLHVEFNHDGDKGSKPTFYLDEMNLMMLGIDHQGRIVAFNRTAELITGYTQAEVIGLDWIRTLVPQKQRRAVKDSYDNWYFGRLLKPQSNEPFASPILTKNGQECYMAWRSADIRQNGKLYAVILFGVDISKQKLAEKILREAKEFSEGIVNTARALIIGIDTTGRIHLFNNYAEELTGWPRKEVFGHDWYTTFLPATEQERVRQFVEMVLNSAAGNQDNSNYSKVIEHEIMTRDGEYRIITWSCTVVHDDQGQNVMLVGIGNDITERKRSEEKLRRLSFADGLTGLANRRYFDEEYDREWKRAVREVIPLSIIFCDIDLFKVYNDTYGHLQGG